MFTDLYICIYRVFLKNLHFLIANNLYKKPYIGYNFYIYQIYILWHLIIWLAITRIIFLLLPQERFKLASLFLNTTLGAKEDIIYSLFNLLPRQRDGICFNAVFKIPQTHGLNPSYLSHCTWPKPIVKWRQVRALGWPWPWSLMGYDSVLELRSEPFKNLCSPVGRSSILLEKHCLEVTLCLIFGQTKLWNISK